MYKLYIILFTWGRGGWTAISTLSSFVGAGRTGAICGARAIDFLIGDAIGAADVRSTHTAVLQKCAVTHSIRLK